ncbi:MAG: LamG-like jellyroll fold domain-containing protein [Elusimicrobiota bacterium]
MKRGIERAQALERVVYGLVAAALFAAAMTFSTEARAVELPVDAHTAALWHFDEGSGITLFDATGNGHDGILHGATWADGKFGEGLQFDGIDDYVDIASVAPDWDQEHGTFEMWVLSNVDISQQPGSFTAGLLDSGGWAQWQIKFPGFWPDTQWLLFNIGSLGGVGGKPISSPGNWKANEWHYIAFTWDTQRDPQVQIIIDGVVEASYNGYSYAYDPKKTFTRLGTAYRSTWWNGVIDEVRLSNAARTVNEIHAHWEANRMQEPVAVARPSLDPEDNLVLDGGSSFDPDGEIVSFEWSLVNQDPEGGDFNLSGELAATDTVDIGAYDLTLTVTDNDGLTGTDTVPLAVPRTIQNISTTIQEPGDQGAVMREVIREIINPPGRQGKP